MRVFQENPTPAGAHNHVVYALTGWCLLPIPFLLILALHTNEASAQSVPERRSIESFLQSIRPTPADSTEVGLTLVDHDLSPDGRDLTITLRNEHWKDITAWSISRAHGTSAGAAFIGTSGQDDFFEIAADPRPIAPGIESGKTIVHTIRFSEPVDLSIDRFDRGNFEVLVLSPGAVIFSDGTFAGTDVQFLRGALTSRYRYLEDILTLAQTLDNLRDDQGTRSRYFAELASRDRLTLPERTLRHTYQRARVNPTKDAPVEAIALVHPWLDGALERGLPHLPSHLRQSLTSRNLH